jgi:hypothetical protein
VRRETRTPRERHSFSKLTRSSFDFVTSFDKPGSQGFEKRNVRRICKIDPDTHRGSKLKFD